jgi:protocatechuate 3,4-dioxygenase, beta subunit
MSSSLPISSRRLFLASAALPLFTVRGAFANLLDDLTKTPAQTEGPFYPNKLPLDTDNDLIVVNDGITPAVGSITHLTGKILDAKGNPIKNALVEIWQCDANGIYPHTGDSDQKKDQQDKNFQGFGRFLTNANGEYYFRTIKPVPYPGRSPHIHYKIKKGGKHLLTTQCYIKGHPGNERDGIWRSVRDEKQRDAITIEFAKMKDSKAGELAAKFDVVIGATPEG